MSEPDQVQRRIIDAVTGFESRTMALKPAAATVSFSEPYLIVTLRGAISEAERRYAQDGASRELLDKLYGDVFDAAKPELEAAVAAIVGRRIRRSRISIDPLLGDAILIFVFAGSSGKTESMEPSGVSEPPGQ